MIHQMFQSQLEDIKIKENTKTLVALEADIRIIEDSKEEIIVVVAVIVVAEVVVVAVVVVVAIATIEEEEDINMTP